MSEPRTYCIEIVLREDPGDASFEELNVWIRDHWDHLDPDVCAGPSMTLDEVAKAVGAGSPAAR